MRFVAIPPTAHAKTPEALVREAADLGARFPASQLRKVTLARASELDLRADASGGTRVWLALECLQRTGSFKIRGALHAVATRLARGETSFLAVSAGNHGAGVALAAKILGVRMRVVVPTTAPKAKCDRMRAAGAEILFGPTEHYDDAEAMALKLAAEERASFVSPYDDELVVAGNGGSLALEIADALGRVPDRVLAPFGGGGLATGLAWGFAARAKEETLDARRVYGAQSEASPVMADSLAQGAAIERFLPTIPTHAEGLSGGVSIPAFARARDALAGVMVVSEDLLERAMTYARHELGLQIEGSAAAGLAPLLAGLPEAARGGDLVAVVTGRNVDRARWEEATRHASW